MYDSLIKNTRKKEISDKHIKGLAVTNSIRFSGKEVGVANVYDACLATNFVYEFFGKFSSKRYGEIIANDIKIVAGKYGPHKKVSLPSPD